MSLTEFTYKKFVVLQKIERTRYVFKRPLWLRALIDVLYWYIKETHMREIQIGRLTKQLERAEEKATRIRNYLRAAELQGELSFHEALELTGLFVDTSSDPYAKYYDESKRDYSNPFADMSDEEFATLQLLPPRIVGAQYLRSVPP